MNVRNGGAIIDSNGHNISVKSALTHSNIGGDNAADGGLTKNGAVEYANDGIRVNAVCPGAIMTPLMYEQPEERQQEILAPQAMNRFGDPAEVAAAVVWLCSPHAGHITGSSIPLDGGWTAA